jgi:hypothetical protein
MPPIAERFRSSQQILRARLLMAGAFIGALSALTLSVVFSWSDAAAGGAGGGSGRLSPAADEAFHAPPHTCLTWSQRDAADAHKVDCAQPHLFEVSSVVDISAEFPAGAPSPSLDVWQQISQAHCADDAKTYLGRPLDPYGRLMVNLLRPTIGQWAAGDRQLRCGLQWTGPGGGPQPTTGAAADQQQSYVWEPGTCLALNGKSVGDPIDCTQQHSYEIIATLDLRTKFTASYPSQSDQAAWLDTECSKAATDYTGGTDLGAKKLILTWDVREQESWDAGSTLVNCKVGAKLDDGSGLAPVQGSLKAAPGGPGDGPPADGGGPPADGGGPPADGGGGAVPPTSATSHAAGG